MEDYSQQTNRGKPICITDMVIYGNICEFSTKTDEDPKSACVGQHW